MSNTRQAVSAGRPSAPRAANFGRSFLVWSVLGLVSLASLGCNQKMDNEPKYIPLRTATFYSDEMSARPLVDHTVPRGYLKDDDAFYTGKTAGGPVTPASAGAAAASPPPAAAMPPASTSQPAPQPPGTPGTVAANLASNVLPKTPGQTDIDYFPIEVTMDVLRRGHERFGIFCSPCHSKLGDGEGMIVRRGFRQPPSFHTDRLRNAPVGHFFDVITNGFGAMSDYAEQIPPADRWAIIAYIRALQLSQNAALADVPQDQLGKIQSEGQQK